MTCDDNQQMLPPSHGTQQETTGGPLCDSDFEADLTKAIDLSLAEEEELCAIADQYDPPTSTEQCPVCNDYLVLSKVAFKDHVDRCLDQDECTSTPVSTWRHFFQSIPTAIQDTFGGKVTATTNAMTTDNTTSDKQQQPKQIPDYKWMKDTKFVVDAFSYGKIPDCKGYFLTHFHADHYHGLTQTWNHGPIYCSQITANLITTRLNVDTSMIRVLAMDQSISINSNVKVTLIDANHCPGSVLFIFDIQQQHGTWIRHVHTGDFRASPAMCLHPLLCQPENPTIDHLYLDTTYLDAKYGFPAQEESIQAACRLVQEHANNDVLVVVGSYTIGKEKVFLAIAKLLGCKVFVPLIKKSILGCQENMELESMLTNDQKEAQVHVLPLNDIKTENMHAYLKSLAPRFTKLVAIRPSGWTHQVAPKSNDQQEIDSLSQATIPPTDRQLTLTPQPDSTAIVQIYGVPYSEHSSYRELASFIASLDINHVIPTVNNDSQRMMRYLDQWKKDKLNMPVQVVPYPVETHW